MIQRPFRIMEAEELEKICRLADKYTNIDIDAKTNSYIVDCKSPMGLMSIGINKVIVIIVHTDDEKMADEFFEGIKAIIKKDINT